MKTIRQPIIIIGMHRSGTTMIAKILKQFGLFIGWELDAYCEAMFFLRRNEKILKVFNGGWDNPGVIDHLFDHPSVIDAIAHHLSEDLNSLGVFSYLGPKLFSKYRSVFELDVPWGWKDPRNTFLLPVWLRVFPRAKIIHIYRNGIDVAQSLSVREQNWIEVINHERDMRRMVDEEIVRFKRKGILLYLVDFMRLCQKRLDRLRKYEDLKVHPCVSLDVGFDLWCTYVDRAYSVLQGVSNEVLHIKYEDFLENSRDGVVRLLEFCDLSSDHNAIDTVCARLDSGRVFAFKSDERLLEFYQKRKNNDWMKKLGYHNIS